MRLRAFCAAVFVRRRLAFAAVFLAEEIPNEERRRARDKHEHYYERNHESRVAFFFGQLSHFVLNRNNHILGAYHQTGTRNHKAAVCAFGSHAFRHERNFESTVRRDIVVSERYLSVFVYGRFLVRVAEHYAPYFVSLIGSDFIRNRLPRNKLFYRGFAYRAAFALHARVNTAHARIRVLAVQGANHKRTEAVYRGDYAVFGYNAGNFFHSDYNAFVVEFVVINGERNVLVFGFATFGEPETYLHITACGHFLHHAAKLQVYFVSGTFLYIGFVNSDFGVAEQSVFHALALVFAGFVNHEHHLTALVAHNRLAVLVFEALGGKVFRSHEFGMTVYLHVKSAVVKHLGANNLLALECVIPRRLGRFVAVFSHKICGHESVSIEIVSVRRVGSKGERKRVFLRVPLYVFDFGGFAHIAAIAVYRDLNFEIVG